MTTVTATAITTESPRRSAITVQQDASLLQLMWLASPALPIGGFSYSEGLESFVHHLDEGIEAATVETLLVEWLHDQLHQSLAKADLTVVGQAIRAWRSGDLEKVQTLNDWLLHTRETAEFRAQTEQMGRSLLEWLRNHTTASAANIDAAAHMQPSYPIAFALAAGSTQAALRDCLLAYTFGWAENMVQAAIKSVPLGQSAGQRILSALAADIPFAVDHALALGDGERQAFSPMLAIRSSQHEVQYSRLFRS